MRKYRGGRSAPARAAPIHLVHILTGCSFAMHLRTFAPLLMCFALAACAHAPVANGPVNGVGQLAADAVATVDTAAFARGSFTAADGTVLPYRILPPRHVRAGQRYPLVLQLHGSGGIGTDNTAQLDRLARSWAMPATRDRYPAYVLVPQFAGRSAHYGAAAADQAATAAPTLLAALALARHVAATHPVDTSRIYAVGFSMGGSAAWLSPTLAPDQFAAIVSIAGIAPPDSAASAYIQVPVLAMHGDTDEENPITADRRFVRALRARGGHAVLREYHGLAHQPPADIVPGTWWRDWLFQQKQTPPH